MSFPRRSTRRRDAGSTPGASTPRHLFHRRAGDATGRQQRPLPRLPPPGRGRGLGRSTQAPRLVSDEPRPSSTTRSRPLRLPPRRCPRRGACGGVRAPSGCGFVQLLADIGVEHVDDVASDFGPVASWARMPASRARRWIEECRHELGALRLAPGGVEPPIWGRSSRTRNESIGPDIAVGWRNDRRGPAHHMVAGEHGVFLVQCEAQVVADVPGVQRLDGVPRPSTMSPWASAVSGSKSMSGACFRWNSGSSSI